MERREIKRKAPPERNEKSMWRSKKSVLPSGFLRTSLRLGHRARAAEERARAGQRKFEPDFDKHSDFGY